MNHTFVSTKKQAIIDCLKDIGINIPREVLNQGLDQAVCGKEVCFLGGDIAIKVDPATENRDPCFIATVQTKETI